MAVTMTAVSSGTAQTKLDAVNEMIEALGEPPADSLDTGGTSTVADAERVLDREKRRVLGEGWAANTILEKTYSPDGNNEIVLGSDVIKVRPVHEGRDSAERRSTDQDWAVAIRDGKLYNRVDDDFTFDDDIELEVVKDLDFTKLPDKLAEYIVKFAAWKLQRFLKRGQIDDEMAQQELSQARVAALQEDGDLKHFNVFETAEAKRLKGDRQNHLTRATTR